MWKYLGCLLLAGFLACSPKPPVDLPSAPHAIIERYLEAIGGREQLLQIQTLRKHGAVLKDGLEEELNIFHQPPHKMRTVHSVSLGQKVNVFVDGQSFEVTAVGNLPVDSMNLHVLSREAQLFPPLYYATTQVELQYLSTELVEGEKVDKLKVIYPDGFIWYEFYEQKSGLLVKLVAPNKGIVLLQQYREVAGIKFPFVKIAPRTYGPAFKVQFTEIEVNPPLDPRLFEFRKF